MNVIRLAAIALCAALLTSCHGERSGKVDPADYDAFFLWAGVRAQPVLNRAKVLYVLAGELRHDDPGRMVPLRAVPHVLTAEVWLTIRVERLDWQQTAYDQVLRALSEWESAGNRLAGLQIDFDAATQGLDGYALFLSDLRRRLPARYRLSVTGLMDWSAHGDPAALAKLAGVVDELVMQTYQGRQTIPGYRAYFSRIAQLPLPYKVALVQGGEWTTPPQLASDPQFRGYVVFLVNPQRRDGAFHQAKQLAGWPR